MLKELFLFQSGIVFLLILFHVYHIHTFSMLKKNIELSRLLIHNLEEEITSQVVLLESTKKTIIDDFNNSFEKNNLMLLGASNCIMID